MITTTLLHYVSFTQLILMTWLNEDILTFLDIYIVKAEQNISLILNFISHTHTHTQTSHQRVDLKFNVIF